MERYPDIEIYLAKADIKRLDAWLSERLNASPLTPAGKRKWRSHGHQAEESIPVLLIENAADGYASLWFDSPVTPWPRDVDCAREAVEWLNCEVRCSLGGWQPGDDPDRFWQIRPDSSEEALHWPDSGQ
ncbi:hypothetical protein [Halomonas sp. PR-M31]|uniref:hypothetical protein n=1 Tax=Halomonas sp. PR-M31 TaxID=1471202 RepID=UPI0006503C54|nr:hypothetical protein [Halomonas sp. PR-M31]